MHLRLFPSFLPEGHVELQMYLTAFDRAWILYLRPNEDLRARFEEVVLPVIDDCALRTVRQTDSASLSSAVRLVGNGSLELWAA